MTVLTRLDPWWPSGLSGGQTGRPLRRHELSCPSGLTADPLQNNSNLLQCNSNLTAIEFQQLQSLCVLALFCIGRISPDFTGFRRKWPIKRLCPHQNRRISGDLCGIDFQYGRIRLT
jgi:hypothetical protein